MNQSTVNFYDIKEKLKTLDFIAGSFLFQTSKKKTFKDWAPVLFLIFGTTLAVLFTYGTISQHQLILHILEVMVKLIFICMYVTLGILNFRKSTVNNLVNWCGQMYDPLNYATLYGESTYHIAKKHIIKVHNETKMVLKWLPIIMHADTAIVSFGVGIVFLVIPNTLIEHSKYKLPIPYYLPFEEQETFIHYMITIICQCICCASLINAVSVVMGVFLCVVLHVIAYLDFINELIEVIGEELKNSKKNDEELDSCLKNIASMVTQVLEIVTTLSDLYTYFFLLIEIATFGALITCGLTFLVLHQQYAVAVATLLAAVHTYFICFASEKINDKFSNIANNIYDFPWYDLHPKQRKIILQTMLCGQINLLFKAAGIHYVTQERFLDLVKTAYSNCIVLKNLVLK